jgi:mono/diheme cytochrome c family protein
MDNNRLQREAVLGAFFILLSSILLIYAGFKDGVFDPGSNKLLVDLGIVKLLESSGPNKLERAEASQHALSIESGAALFNAACAECHNPDGKGLIGPPLNNPALFDTGPEGRLAQVGWSGSLRDYLIATISAGRPISTQPAYPGKQDGSYAMPAWSTQFGGPLRPDQIRNLADFILNFQAEASGEVSVTRVFAELEQDPADKGRAVFNQMGCGACHTIAGVSAGAVGPELTLIADTAATRIPGMTAEEFIRQSILDPASFISPECPTGACPDPTTMPLDFADRLTEEQLTNLLIYLLTLTANQP